jgi:hypothetical protein
MQMGMVAESTFPALLTILNSFLNIKINPRMKYFDFLGVDRYSV